MVAALNVGGVWRRRRAAACARRRKCGIMMILKPSREMALVA